MFGLDANLLAATLGGVVALVFAFAWMKLGGNDKIRRRTRQLNQRNWKDSTPKQSRRRFMGTNPARSTFSQLANSIAGRNAEAMEAVRTRLVRAGFRDRGAVNVYLLARLFLPLVVAFGAYSFVTFGTEMETHMQLLISCGGAVLGWLLPDLVVNHLAKKRSVSVQRALPDGLDLLVICAESGLSLDMALSRVSGELYKSSPELAEELDLTSAELNFLPERRQALVNLAERTDLRSLRGVVNTLIQTEKYGTPLAQSLRVLSAEMREERMLAAEEKAARLPATLTVPMIVFILPTLFIVLAGPAIIDVSDSLVK